MSSTQMILRIDEKVKGRLDRLARMEGKTTSKMLRELIEQYIEERDIAPYIDGLWDKIGAKLSAKGATAEGVGEAVKTVRSRRK